MKTVASGGVTLAVIAFVAMTATLSKATSSPHVGSGKAAPNIIFIMADDLGWGEVGAYPSESEHGRIATPNLDKFAAEGMRFTQAYSGYTVCAPSRTTLFTGRHSGQFQKANFSGTSLRPGEAVTVAELLKQEGYRTAMVGKAAPLTSPLEQGFDYFIGQVSQSECHNMYPKSIDFGTGTSNFPLPLNAKNIRSRENCMANPEEYNYTVDITQSRSLSWLKKTVSESRSEPFFLYMSFTVPHAGGWGSPPNNPESGAPVPSDGQYADESWPDVEKDHAAVITYLDQYVGETMATLQSLGVDEDTVVFFASDNGAHLEGGHSIEFFNSTGGLRGHKRSLYEGGVRSPTMVRWPGKIEEAPLQTCNGHSGT